MVIGVMETLCRGLFRWSLLLNAGLTSAAADDPPFLRWLDPSCCKLTPCSALKRLASTFSGSERVATGGAAKWKDT